MLKCVCVEGCCSVPAAPALVVMLALWIASGFLFPKAPGALGNGGRDSVLVRIQWLPEYEPGHVSSRQFFLERVGSDGEHSSCKPRSSEHPWL